MNNKLVCYSDIIFLKKELLIMQKSKLQLSFIYKYLKVTNREYFKEIDRDYRDFLGNLNYSVDIKKNILKYLRFNYKTIMEDDYNEILKILNLLKKFDEMNIQISNNIINIINSYQNNYIYVCPKKNEEIKIYKLIIDECIKKYC